METNWIRGSCIGRGAHGTVNLAVSLSNGAVFAIKSVDLNSSQFSQLQYLENEIRILKSISSPFIVKYLGDDTTSSHRNLHIEYLPRGTAAAEAYSSPLKESTIRSYTWCLVSALSYLHSIGITHCDVKGKNVLLGPSPGSVKLADFGSAVETSSAGRSPRGSPLWMAPEVIRGDYQGPESDVWSLGCTVIEMLTGNPAWGADAESIRRIGYSSEPPLFPARLSSLGCDFLEKCFERDFRKRWSCDQLLQHPFISVCCQRDLIVDSSPRCVLDGFDLNFDESNGEGDANLNLNLNLEAKERLRGLISGGGANWETEGWVVVREDGEGTSSEYFNLVGADEEIYEENVMEFSYNLNSNLLSDEYNYRTLLNVAEPQHFRSYGSVGRDSHFMCPTRLERD
ncbi:hypothetical protein ACJIZ3_012510 [Penstemon smallii]|uniref:Protein kinase domain-containing protein n=1 Tax=Penstemon smallii TaxID=265156 RepID=A0ABD3UQ57_9LAMI